MFKKNKYSKKELKKVKPILDKVENLKEQMRALSDEELKNLTPSFQLRLLAGETLDDILPEAYAAIREADRRVLGKEPYKVQVIGAIILHQGKVAELKTGEGKTLLSTMPAYLNALTRRGVHIVTVNEYLAKRDADEMGQVHQFMGLSVGCVTADMTKDQRRAEYACDITYVTNTEVGFDYLRDNMVQKKTDRVQRGLTYAIIDEVDSVLIDEARTPLIISGVVNKNNLLYGTCDILAKSMEKGTADAKFNKTDAIMGKVITETGDFIVDEKDKVITLTAQGIEKAEKFLHLSNLSGQEHLEEYHGLITALKANYLMRKNKDYIVKDGEVLIVDESTGRVLEGRRYSDGLHQAIEAKERVEIKKETQTLATITYQNFFNKYKKKSGMTGTGKTEEEEFKDIYSMDVVVVPTNKPVIRLDLPDLVFKTKEEKLNAICEEVLSSYMKHQPVLVGVPSVKDSEILSNLLSKMGIPHNVLNAKNDELEASIIAKAGEAGAVTVATNMAGRGTDIKLDEESLALGGLKVIGTERHDSRRVDNQLRGRSGRQGDPGVSQFFISLEDDVLQFFSKESWIHALKNASTDFGQPISHRKLTKAVEYAQKHIEENNYGVRKQVFEYDSVNNEHREFIYRERNRVLDGEDVEDVYRRAINSIVNEAFKQTVVGKHPSSWDIVGLNEQLKLIVPIDDLTSDETSGMTRDDFKKVVLKKVFDKFEAQSLLFNKTELSRYERQVLIYSIDKYWKDHLENLDYLKQWVGVHAYGQKDPRYEYKRISSKMLDDMITHIYKDILQAFFR